MSRGAKFLNDVTGQLKERIREIDQTICDVHKDIAEMNEYYWENYTEMDQYGYENYDNQQALFSQVNASQEHQKQRSLWRRMLDSPFFGSVDFVYDGEDESETFYIGIGNFAKERGGVPLIYDWRAPVSGLFYDYDKGAASYRAPAGDMEGEILSKWQYKIRGGKMVYEFESDMKIDDDILKQELSANSDTQLKNIVRTIQREQNAIIRNTKDKILIIQGAAGSGKTSIALHRIAYLLYHDRGRLKSSNILILSPNSVFSDYISHILPELGEENIQEMSFDLFAYRQLRDTAKDCEDRWDQIERQMRQAGGKICGGEGHVHPGVEKGGGEGHVHPGVEKGGGEGHVHPGVEKGGGEGHVHSDVEKNGAAEDARYRWKQSKAYAAAVEGFLVELEDRLVDFKDIRYERMEKKAEDILHMFYFRFQNIPLLSRMDAVMEYVVDEYETLCGRSIPGEELEVVKEKFYSMYVTRDIYEIYNWLLEEYGWERLPDLPWEERVLAYEDVYPMLYLKYRLLTVSDQRNIRHLVIDEMQDYSYLQYVILERMFSCGMTILGDRAQTVDDQMQDVLTFLPKILGKKVRKIELNRSYRNTYEIAEYANRIAGIQGIEYMERHGRDVEEITCISREEAVDSILGNVNLGEDGYETVAVLAMTEQEARKLYEAIREKRKDVSYVNRDSERFRKGITVTTYYIAKGLEFDQVFVAGGEPKNPFFRQFLYICATRALHELYVLK